MDKKQSIIRDSFLFGFDNSRNMTSREYERYYTFLNIINSVLVEFGIHMGCSGYAYMIDAVKIIIDRRSYEVRLKTDIYPLIAERYHLKTAGAVEHSIRNAINTAYADNIRNPEVNSMGFFTRRPTPKHFLIFLADHVQRGMFESLIRNAG